MLKVSTHLPMLTDSSKRFCVQCVLVMVQFLCSFVLYSLLYNNNTHKQRKIKIEDKIEPHYVHFNLMLFVPQKSEEK